MKIGRREALATLGTLAAGGGVGWLRIADIRRRNTDTVSLSEQPPRAAIHTAAQRLRRLDHRADMTVTVLKDGTGDTPYESAHHRVFHQPSRRRTWLSYTTKQIPAGNPGAVIGTDYAMQHTYEVAERGGGPGSSVLYLSDGFLAYNYDAPVPTTPDERPKLGDDPRESLNDGYLDLNPTPMPEHVHEHRAEWGRIEQDAETVTYRITDTDKYAQIPPLPNTRSLGENCAITVTLDRETGYLTHISDTREAVRVPQADDGERTRTYTYEIETDFTQYGSATAPKPRESLDLALGKRLQGSWYDFKRY